jgi:hypothetical protein
MPASSSGRYALYSLMAIVQGLNVLQYHNESVLKKYGEKLKVGTLKEEAKL